MIDLESEDDLDIGINEFNIVASRALCYSTCLPSMSALIQLTRLIKLRYAGLPR